MIGAWRAVGRAGLCLGLCVGLLGIAGCATDLQAIPGTTIRTGPSVDAKKGVVFHVFRDRDECLGRGDLADTEAEKEETRLCDPFVDRASGQVRFAFQTQLDNLKYPINLERDDLLLRHSRQTVAAREMLLTGHKPIATNQLFILLIDVSGSMKELDEGLKGSRMDRVRSALLRGDVVDAFFPAGAKTAVLPMTFSSGTPVPLAQKRILTNAEEYRAAIRTLNIGQGYTHLYNAIKYTAGLLETDKEIIGQLDGTEGKQPVIIAMTDGFNNESPADLCRDNAPRLRSLVEGLDKQLKGENVRARPTVYAVGIGRKTRGREARRAPGRREEERDELLAVGAQRLCGQYVDRRIDGDLENEGVDHVAMDWIANAGGGQSFIQADGSGLAEAFKSAARKKYTWYDLKYKVDPFHLRRSFEVKVGLFWQAGRDAGQMKIFPSAWIDAPPGRDPGDGWVVATPYSRTLVVLLPVVSLLIIAGYLPSARFNLMRALFSRIRQK